METVQIREAKASFSALVAAAEKGRPTLVSRHGQPCAMIVPVAEAQLQRTVQEYPLEMPNLATYLLALPEAWDAAPFQTERDTTPLREVDFG